MQNAPNLKIPGTKLTFTKISRPMPQFITLKSNIDSCRITLAKAYSMRISPISLWIIQIIENWSIIQILGIEKHLADSNQNMELKKNCVHHKNQIETLMLSGTSNAVFPALRSYAYRNFQTYKNGSTTRTTTQLNFSKEIPFLNHLRQYLELSSS